MRNERGRRPRPSRREIGRVVRQSLLIALVQTVIAACVLALIGALRDRSCAFP